MSGLSGCGDPGEGHRPLATKRPGDTVIGATINTSISRRYGRPFIERFGATRTIEV